MLFLNIGVAFLLPSIPDQSVRLGLERLPGIRRV